MFFIELQTLLQIENLKAKERDETLASNNFSNGILLVSQKKIKWGFCYVIKITMSHALTNSNLVIYED